jgi:exosortase A-associated hydrolase 2
LKIFQEAFYLPVEAGSCFAVYRAPETPASATMLHLPAFCDEMNKARAMTASAARAFAEAGVAVLQVDWLGCGDSTGEHRDAMLSQWIRNARVALAWLRERHPGIAAPWLWALRAGALLVPGLVEGAPETPLLLWQPVMNGGQQLNQLLRLVVAAGVTGAGGGSSSTQALRARLAAGETLEIGGYAMSPHLAAELDAAAFRLPDRHRAAVVWFEVGRSPGATLSDPAQREIERARAAGTPITASVVEGPGFWQSAEIERCNALIEASTAAIAEGLRGVSRATALL